METGVDLLAGLFHFRLGLVKKDRYMYALYDLDTDNMYEDMSIYYIRYMVREWTNKRNKNV